MIGVDTNILVRVFVPDDDPAQTAAALAFLDGHSADDPVYVSAVVVTELVWVLHRAYEFSMVAIHGALGSLFESANVRVEPRELLAAAISGAMDRNADIADSIIAALALDAGCLRTMTFDGKAARRIPGMALLT